MQNKNVCLMWLFVLAFLATATQVSAQNKTEDDELPEAQAVSIESTDGVLLKCMWYPGTEGKQTVPVILVHDLERTRDDMLPLAEHLQKEGHAVIVPDLRGHGLSTTVAGEDDPIDYSEFKKAQLASMVIDIDTCKRFLMRRNNAGELNIEMLTVVANHRSCIHAVNWAVSDWAWPRLADGTKQGQDIKALVLISPVKRYKSLSMNSALKAPCMSGKGIMRPISVTMVWGRQAEKIDREVDSIYRLILKGRTDPSEIPMDEKWDRQTLFQFPLQNDEEGSDMMVGNSAAQIDTNVAGIIKKTIAEKAEDFLWQDRSSK